jgi:hypothetical protein
MKKILAHPTAAALIGLLLALPGMTLFVLLVLNIEPPLGPLAPLVEPPAQGPAVVGSLIALSFFVLLIAAFSLNLRPLLRIVRAGAGVLARPLNFLVALVTLSFILSIVGGIVVDQYPCWMGVPNCD